MERIADNVYQMCLVRGYTDIQRVHQTSSCKYMTNLVTLVTAKTGDGIPISVWMTSSKMGKTKMQKFVNDNVGSRTILITDTPLTHHAKLVLEEAKKSTPCQTFLFTDLSYNILGHSLQPKFHIMNSGEIEKEITSVYKCSLQNLPKISAQDPVCRYLGVTPKTVLRIERPRGYLYYRIVV